MELASRRASLNNSIAFVLVAFREVVYWKQLVRVVTFARLGTSILELDKQSYCQVPRNRLSESCSRLSWVVLTKEDLPVTHLHEHDSSLSTCYCNYRVLPELSFGHLRKEQFHRGWWIQAKASLDTHYVRSGTLKRNGLAVVACGIQKHWLQLRKIYASNRQFSTDFSAKTPW